jgi:uncharacterized protein YaeQ
MAQQATVYRFQVQLSHVDRGVYEALDLRLARHPSESERFLLSRLFAWCFLVEEGLEPSKGGLSSPEEPALAVKTLDGRLQAWIEIGNPSWERLHKAAKAAPRVVVFTHHDPALLLKEVEGKKIHRVEQIEVRALDAGFLDAVARHVGDRGARLEVTISDGELYVDIGGESLHCALPRIPLGPP